MPVKKQKNVAENYIVINTSNEEIIAIGERSTILDILQGYIDAECMEEDEVKSYIEIYVLGESKHFNIHKTFDITIEE